MKTVLLVIVALFIIVGLTYDPIKNSIESAKEYWDARPKATPKSYTYTPKSTPKPTPIPTKRPTRVSRSTPKPQLYVKLTFPYSHYAVRRGSPIVIKWQSNIYDKQFEILVGGKKSFDKKFTWTSLGWVYGADRQLEWHVPEDFPYRQITLYIGVPDKNYKRWITKDQTFLYVR